MSIPVVVASNGIGTPVTPVEANAPAATIVSNGQGMPIAITETNGMPLILSGLPWPGFYMDLTGDYYWANGAQATFDEVLTHTRAGNATMVDSDGLLKWAPHNLAVNSATPATQSITVVDGADYTVEISGSGSVALSGAGTGTVTDGTPVEVTASTTTLTLTVTGSPDAMWAYRSDLGGMVNNPDTGTSYVPTEGSAIYLPRRNHHVFDGTSWVNRGLLIEPEAATNLLLSTDTLSTQSATVTAEPHTLHFTGTGTVTLSGAATDGPLVGTGTGENNRVSLTFTPSAGSLTLTVSGAVSHAQLETGSVPTSYIPTYGATATRAAETLTAPAEVLPWGDAVSIQMDGMMTYADNDSASELTFWRWPDGGFSIISAFLGTNAGSSGRAVFYQDYGFVPTIVSSEEDYPPGINMPFSIASRHGSTFINGAKDGTAETADTTPINLPDPENEDLLLFPDGASCIISGLRIWPKDIGDAGIEEASS